MSGPPRAAGATATRAPYGVRRGVWLWTTVFGGILASVVVGAPLVGSTKISLLRAFDGSVPFADNVDAQIFFIARLPRVLAAALVGSALAAAGVVLQALLRNPLATPFTLGVSAGAALGAMTAMSVGLQVSVLGVSAVTLASFLGSLGAVAIVYALARARRQGFSTNVLLLAGVTLNSFFSALILLVQYLADASETMRTVRWLMGDLDVASYVPLAAALPLLVVAGLVFAWLPRALNLLSLDVDAAAARGVNVVRVQQLAFFSASVATGAAVSLGGPIGFVGIIVAAFLIVCDVVARMALAPLELPVGIITAIIGGPFFLWLLVRQR